MPELHFTGPTIPEPHRTLDRQAVAGRQVQDLDPAALIFASVARH